MFSNKRQVIVQKPNGEKFLALFQSNFFFVIKGTCPWSKIYVENEPIPRGLTDDDRLYKQVGKDDFERAVALSNLCAQSRYFSDRIQANYSIDKELARATEGKRATKEHLAEIPSFHEKPAIPVGKGRVVGTFRRSRVKGVVWDITIQSPQTKSCLVGYVEGGYKGVELKFRDFGDGRGQVYAIAHGNDTSQWDSPEFYTSHVFKFRRGDESNILAVASKQLLAGETRGHGLGGDVNEAIAEAGWPDKHGVWLP